MPLQPQVALEPFENWGMDFIGPFGPPSGQKKYIIVCTGYLTKWVETKAAKETIEDKVVDFLRENIFYKFGYPREIVTNQANQFTSHLIENLLRRDWADILVEATWAYNTTWKTNTGFTPCDLVYGKKYLLSIEFDYNTLRMAAQFDLDVTKAQQERLLQLNGLDEFKMQALFHTKVIQLRRTV
eukprot:PITA_16877